jgi:hypothetical protein
MSQKIRIPPNAGLVVEWATYSVTVVGRPLSRETERGPEIPEPRARALTAFRKVVATPTSPLLWVTLSLKGRNIPAIVDTGAQFSCIRSDVVEYLYLTGEPCSFLLCYVSFLLANGTMGQVSNAVKLHVSLHFFSWNHEFKVFND